MKFIGKILPVDGYFVLLKGNLPVDYAKSLTHLYQPLIGINAVMLYQTLLHEIEFQKASTDLQTHHTLMNYLNIPLDEIYEARLYLEGIGLLNTYEQNMDTGGYTYELQIPFSPSSFFQDAMLSQLLLHHIGKSKYVYLREHYTQLPTEQGARNITASFSDVFQTFQPSTDNIESITNYQGEDGPKLDAIDFTWMEQMLKQRMIPLKRVLTRDNKRVIKQMMVLYDLTSYEIEKTVLWALTEENVLDLDEFKEACHDLFKTKNKNAPIKLVDQKPTSKQIEVNHEEMTKEEQLIHELETISPKQLLADLSSGNQASEQDMKVIREVMTSQGLPAPVMNVLIHYVLLQSNMKLSKAYMEKIASHWSRANLTTAKEAMFFAKKEKDRFRQGATQKQNYRNYNRQKQMPAEIVPDWFKERNDKQPKKAGSPPPVIDFEKEQEEIAAALKQYAKKNKNNHFQG